MMGTAGNLSIFFIMPIMGGIWDHYTQLALPAGQELQALLEQAKTDQSAAATLEAARVSGAAMPFRWTSLLPVVLAVVFGLIWLRDRARGGYKVVRLQTVPKEPDRVPVARSPPSCYDLRIRHEQDARRRPPRLQQAPAGGHPGP
jgi:hypothetical protein